jgi:hypothetical protein
MEDSCSAHGQSFGEGAQAEEEALLHTACIDLQLKAEVHSHDA